jgi:hypothetical protein
MKTAVLMNQSTNTTQNGRKGRKIVKARRPQAFYRLEGKASLNNLLSADVRMTARIPRQGIILASPVIRHMKRKIADDYFVDVGSSYGPKKKRVKLNESLSSSEMTSIADSTQKRSTFKVQYDSTISWV